MTALVKFSVSLFTVLAAGWHHYAKAQKIKRQSIWYPTCNTVSSEDIDSG